MRRAVVAVTIVAAVSACGCFDLGFFFGPTECGGEDGVSCGLLRFCKYEDGVCGGDGDGDGGTNGATGVCTLRPTVCTLEFSPVCGCDDQTYGNECEASAAGVSIAYRSECEPAGDFCGGIAGVPCEEGFYCRFEEGTCGAADQSGTCQEVPDVCIEIFQPVCGCDGVTYSNDCFAAAAGVSIVSRGPCEAP